MNNFYVTQDWMISKLGLKGNELNVYAIIFGFSQDKESVMKGGVGYICSFLQISKPTAIKILSSLLERGLIECREFVDKTCKRKFYRISDGRLNNLTKGGKEIEPRGVKELNQGGLNNLTKGGKETLPSNNNKEINKGNKEKNISPYVDISKVPEEHRWFYEGMLKNYPNVCKMKYPLLYEEYLELKNQYSNDSITYILLSMETWPKILRNESAFRTAKKWLVKEQLGK